MAQNSPPTPVRLIKGKSAEGNATPDEGCVDVSVNCVIFGWTFSLRSERATHKKEEGKCFSDVENVHNALNTIKCDIIWLDGCDGVHVCERISNPSLAFCIFPLHKKGPTSHTPLPFNTAPDLSLAFSIQIQRFHVYGNFCRMVWSWCLSKGKKIFFVFCVVFCWRLGC